MNARNEKREREETASRDDSLGRWLVVSEPLAVDDDPDWDGSHAQSWSYDRAA
jgi:hypothetical protein